MTRAEVKIEKFPLSQNFTGHSFQGLHRLVEKSVWKSINPVQLEAFEIERSAKPGNLKNRPGVMFGV